MPQIIIHVSGSPGSGKTTLGNKLKTKYGNKIVVKDLDDLFKEFMNASKSPFDPKKYQIFIDNFIKTIKTKIIVFVGLNKEHLTETLYNIKPAYKFFIDLPIEINLERHFIREMNAWLTWMTNRDKDILFNQLVKDENDVIKGLSKSLKRTLQISKQRKFIESFAEMYKKEKYEFVSHTLIEKKIIKLINSLLLFRTIIQ